jgi:hypothetical protein
MNLNVDEILQDSGLRPLNSDRVAHWKKEFEQGREVPAILVDENLVVVDGNHRLTAARLLKHKTIAAERHIATPFDLNGRQKIADAISAATKEAVARVPFIDRRNAIEIRSQLACKKNQLRLQEEDATKAEQYIVKVTGQIAALQTLLKKYRKLLDKSPHYAGLVDETSLKIGRLEHDLAFAKKDLDRIEGITTSLKKLIKEFLSLTPAKGYPTNGEMLVADDDLKEAEREARGESFPTIY